MPEFRLGRHALITGGGTGIGAAAAAQLSAAGAKLSLFGRRMKPLQAVAESYGAFAVGCDVTNAGQIAKAFDEARTLNGPIDLLIVNAGIAESAPFHKMTRESWDRIIGTNLTAAFECSRAAIGDLLKSDNGRLVFIASVASLRGVPYASHYAASKHGLLGLMRSLAAEYAKSNMTVNAVCPGYVDTPMTDQSVARVSEITGRSEGDARSAITNMNASGRLVDPQAIGNVIAMLCLPLSRDINGAAITIDGNKRVSFDPGTYQPEHFLWKFEDGVATITLNRPERKNPLTFESYDELRATFYSLDHNYGVKAVVIRGAGGNFCSGGDVQEIIGPLTKMKSEGLLKFTRMTGDLVRAMRRCPQPIVAAVEGVCAGAGAIMAMASDIRFGQPGCKTAFLFSRVGLSGADMGACAILPRLIGHGRAAELLFTGRTMTSDEGLAWGFYNRLVDDVSAEAQALALELAAGPTIAHCITKKQLDAEWNVTIEEALEMEARAQARCMETKDFKRAYEAFSNKQKPVFQGD